MSCTRLKDGCHDSGASLEDAGVYVLDAANAAVDTSAATVVYQWIRQGGNGTASIDLDQTDTEVNRGVGTDLNGVTFSLGSALMVLTAGFYDVLYTVTVSGDVYRSRRVVEVKAWP
jgi:hypothetical protein